MSGKAREAPVKRLTLNVVPRGAIRSRSTLSSIPPRAVVYLRQGDSPASALSPTEGASEPGDGASSSRADNDREAEGGADGT